VAGGNGDGSALNQLASPKGIFIDKNNNMYIADAGNNRIQKWMPNATSGITVAGGNGYGSAANQFRNPADVFVDTLSNIYVSDFGNNRIQKWVPGNRIGTTVAGGHGEGAASNQLHFPIGLYLDDVNNIFVSDAYNNRIQKFAPGETNGVTVAGTGGLGNDSNQLFGPNELFIDLNNSLYVSDRGNNRVQKFYTDSSVNGIDTTYTPTSGGLYTVTAVFKNGCIDTSEAVNVKALPHVYRINGQKRNLCGGGDLVYSIKAFGGNTTYNWNIPAGTILLSGQGTANITVRIPATGFSSGALSITAQNSCGNGPVFTDTLSTKPLRPEPITGPSVVGFQDTVMYSTSSSIEGVTYYWEVPEGVDILSGQGTSAITVQWNRPFHGTVKVFTSLCNEEASAQNIKVILGNPIAGKNLSDNRTTKINKVETTIPVLYPNPSSNTATLNFTAKQQGKYSVTLTTATGQAVMRKEQLFIKGNNTVSLDISRYSKGIYFITILSDQNTRQTFKLVKQ
jgi:hypothetical protein